MDAFSVSLANGLADKNMEKGRMLLTAGTFAGFQFMMPMIGWVMVHTAASRLAWFNRLVPWIAFALLMYIGGKMLAEGIREGYGRGDEGEGRKKDGRIRAADLMMQGTATSIDALSAGFTFAAYNYFEACSSAVVIGVVTFVICMAGLGLGKRMGTVLSGRASVLGGVILIGIGVKILAGVFI